MLRGRARHKDTYTCDVPCPRGWFASFPLFQVAGLVVGRRWACVCVVCGEGEHERPARDEEGEEA